MAVIGNARVSTREQHLDLQLTHFRPPARRGSLPTTASAGPRPNALSSPRPWSGWGPRAELAAAAANNRHGGSPRKVDDAAAARAKELKGKGINASDIGKMLGVSRATVYRYLI
jgi:DNA invertase Pin-like site-specific DNA recombinase